MVGNSLNKIVMITINSQVPRGNISAAVEQLVELMNDLEGGSLAEKPKMSLQIRGNPTSVSDK